MRAALGARIAAEPGLIAPEPAAAVEAATSGLGKLIAVFGAGSSLGFAAGLYVAATYGEPRVREAAAPAPPAMSVAASVGDAGDGVPHASAPLIARVPQLPQAPAVRGSAAAATTAPRATTAPVASARGGDLRAELDGLRRAQELLHEGDATWSLARLDELDRESASSALLEERLATRAMAECVLGRDANATLQTLAQKFPASPHLVRVRSRCAAQPGRSVSDRKKARQ